MHRGRTLAGVFLALSLATLIATAQVVETDTTTIPGGTGSWMVTTYPFPNQERIEIKFTPTTTLPGCTKVALIQTIKRSFDGMAVTRPSDAVPEWAYRDDDTIADGTNVDHLFCERDPYYNGTDPQDTNIKGDGTAGSPTSMADAPTYSDDIFNRVGKNCVQLDFEVCAVCTMGPAATTTQPGYGCIKWKYTRCKGDANDGVSMLVSGAESARSASHLAATTQFVAKHADPASTQPGATTCPEEIPANTCANRLCDLTGPLIFHLNSDYKVKTVSGTVRKANSPNGTPTGTRLRKGDALHACDYILIPNGATLCLDRAGGSLETDVPTELGGGPTATNVDLYRGSIETIESHQCVALQHCGVMVRNCFGQQLCMAAPIDTGDPRALVMYTVDANILSDVVTIRNDALSTAPLFAIDFFGSFFGTVAPGNNVTLFYPGQMQSCVPTPDCNHNGQPDENDIQFGFSLDVNADGVPDECECVTCLGDLTGNSKADGADVQAFVGCLLSPSAPGCMCGDMNSNGAVELLDVSPFVDRLLGRSDPLPACQ
ncbi:MAG: hypothetical protein U1A27_04510 [Phycisphaerae bacterium]